MVGDGSGGMATTTLLRAKVVVVGDSKVGKSALVAGFNQHNYFQRDYFMTMGVNLTVKTAAKIDKCDYQLEMYISDTGGHPLYQSLRPKSWDTCAAVMFCFDITQRSSFTSIKPLVQSFRTTYNSLVQPLLLLVGCKADLHDDRQVEYEEAYDLAQQLGLKFIECSSIGSTPPTTGPNATTPPWVAPETTFDHVTQFFLKKHERIVKEMQLEH